MKIVRDGQEYELTSSELYDAYIEQEEIFDRQNIENNIENYLDEDEYEKLKDNHDFIEEAARQLRRNQDKYDMAYEYALDDAIRSTKKDYLKFVFDNEIIVSDDRRHLEGYVWATDFLVSRLKKELQNGLSYVELSSMENINFYPVYDVSDRTIQLHGHFYYWPNDNEIGKEFRLPLDDEDARRLIDNFEAYCQEQEGKSCLEFVNLIRSEDGLSPLTQNKAISTDIVSKIKSLAQNVRRDMTSTYGSDLAGYCIEASERIVHALSEQLGITARTVEGWCRFDDECYGSDRPWDPHTWAEIPSLKLYVDITADQFNCGMDLENEFSDVIVQEGLPHGMQYTEPAWNDYDLENDIDNTELYQQNASLLRLIHSASSRTSQTGTTSHAKLNEQPER